MGYCDIFLKVYNRERWGVGVFSILEDKNGAFDLSHYDGKYRINLHQS